MSGDFERDVEALVGGAEALLAGQAADVEKARLLLAAHPWFSMWVGQSGELLTGVEVAGHLEATQRLLERVGWTQQLPDRAAPGWALVEAANADIADAFGALLEEGDVEADARASEARWAEARARAEQPVALRLYEALWDVARQGPGDLDTRFMATRCLVVVIAARSGVDPIGVSWEAWESRRGRTWPEVRDLLLAAGAMARRLGPRKPEAGVR